MCFNLISLNSQIKGSKSNEGLTSTTHAPVLSNLKGIETVCAPYSMAKTSRVLHQNYIKTTSQFQHDYNFFVGVKLD